MIVGRLKLNKWWVIPHQRWPNENTVRRS